MFLLDEKCKMVRMKVIKSTLLVGDSNGDYINHRVIESFTESQKVIE